MLPDCCSHVFRHPFPSGNFDAGECEGRLFASNQEFSSVLLQQENAVQILRRRPGDNWTNILFRGHAVHETFSPCCVRTSLWSSSDLRNSRTSATAVSSLMLY